jgi:hypothetical protein
LFVEASAKSGQNVELAFEQASRDILDKIRRGVFEDDRVRISRNFSLKFSARTDVLLVHSRRVSNCRNLRLTHWLWNSHQPSLLVVPDIDDTPPLVPVLYFH